MTLNFQPLSIFSHSPQYGELSLTTNPGFALYNNPIRKFNAISSPTGAGNPNCTTTILRSKSPPNIYTRLPIGLKDYSSTTALSPTLMTSSIVGFGGSVLTSPTKHNLLVTTTPFIENGHLTTTTTNLADQCIHTSILPSNAIRMPLLNVNYSQEIHNRINNGGALMSNGSTGGSSGTESVMSQLSSVNES